jgi:formiminotetrahydrofolate cyclodeaminase
MPMPREPEEAATARNTAIQRALIFASEVPLETARAAAAVAQLAATVAERGNSNASTDGAVAALIAEAACKGAALNVRVNIASLDESTGDVGARLASEARACIDAASVHARLAEAAAERAMSGA